MKTEGGKVLSCNHGVTHLPEIAIPKSFLVGWYIQYSSKREMNQWTLGKLYKLFLQQVGAYSEGWIQLFVFWSQSPYAPSYRALQTTHISGAHFSLPAVSCACVCHSSFHNYSTISFRNYLCHLCVNTNSTMALHQRTIHTPTPAHINFYTYYTVF